MLSEKFAGKKLINGIEGHVTIELFDKRTGKLQHKQKSNNFIAQAGVRHLQWAQRAYYFKDQIHALTSGSGTLDEDYQPVDPYNSIVLTDSTENESPLTEWFMPGKLIGYSTKANYAGSDVYRGTPNPTQSEATNTYTKWVFDWPTNAANGTIGSVGWMHNVKLLDVGSGQFTFNSNASIEQVYQTGVPCINRLARASDSLYFGASTVSGNYTTIYVLDGNFAQTSTFSVGADFTTVQLAGIAWDSANSKLWVLGRSDFSTWKIASYDQSGTRIDGPHTVTTRDYHGLTYDGTGLWSITSSGATVTAYRIATNGSNMSSFPFNVHTNGSYTEYARSIAYETSTQTLFIGTALYRSQYYPPEEPLEFYGTSGSIRVFDLSGNQKGVPVDTGLWKNDVLYTSNFPSNPFLYRNNLYGCYTSQVFDQDYQLDTDFDLKSWDTILVPQKLIYTNTTNGCVMQIRRDGMGSRTKLATPVTKDNTQTMKITYQMNYS